MQDPPQSAAPPNSVGVRPTESPRTRRYGSDEPVVTAVEMYNDVDDSRRTPEPEPRALGAEAEPEGQLDEAVPPIGIERPPTAARRVRCCIARRACFCLTLRQGTLCIGIIQVVNGLLMLLLELMYMLGVLYVSAYALHDDTTGNLPGSEQRWGTLDIAYASLSGILLLQELIILFFAGLLLHGARTERPGYLRGWLIFTAVMLAVGVGTWAARLTLEFMYKPSHGGVLIIRALIELSPTVYFLIVVRSYYYELLDGKETAVDIPLLKDPPPYQSIEPYLDDQAPELPHKRPLETSFDGPTPTTIGPATAPAAPAAPDSRYDLSNDDDDGGFGPGWIQTQSWTAQPNEQAGPLPPKTPLRDSGPYVPIQDSRALRMGAFPYHDDEYEEEDTDDYGEAEMRPRASRRVVGAGPMVLPPLPPGHRASLQHVALDQQPPAMRATHGAPPPGAPTLL